MDLKTGRAKSQTVRNLEKATRATVSSAGVDTRVIEYNCGVGDVDDNTWFVRSFGEAQNSLVTSFNLGTGPTPVFTFTGTSIATYGDAIISRKARIKDAQMIAVQQGSAGNKVFKIWIGYVPFTPGTDIAKASVAATTVGTVQDFTATDDWTLSSKTFTELQNKEIPANSILIISIKKVSGPTNACGLQLKFDLEYKN